MKPPTSIDASRIVYTGSYRPEWEDEPLSAERLCSNPHYLKWARGRYGVRTVAKLRLKHRRAVRKGQKPKYNSDDEIKAIADILSMDTNTLKYTLKRSSRYDYKRR